MKSSRPRKSPKTGKLHQRHAKTGHPQMGHSNPEDHAGSNFRGFRGRGKYFLQGGVLVAVVGIAGMSVAWSPAGVGNSFSTQPEPATQATQASPPEGGEDTLDVNTYLGVQRLRNELCLSRRDMAAMGCDVATASALLQRVVTSYESQRGDLIAARNRVLQSKGLWREAMRQSYQGDDAGEVLTGNQLQLLHEDYKRDVTAYQVMLERIANAMDSGLSADQRALWRSAREADRDGRPPELRYAVDMMEGQREAIAALGGIPVDDEGIRPPSPTEAANLTLGQTDAIEQARVNRAARYIGVVAAEEAVLPVPPELIEDEAGLIDEPLLPPEVPE